MKILTVHHENLYRVTKTLARVTDSQQFPIKPGWLNDPFVLWDISQNNKAIFDLSSPVIVKIWTNYNEISTAQHENRARSSLKSPQSKNLDCSK